ncbi:MAG: hypothetical protein KDC92_13040, partial [Bacteroidetes bacterium]|nr:hypothetical protein [Bacteroidota bacterium]
EIGKNFDTMQWHNAKKLVVYKNKVTPSTLKFEMTKAVDHLDFDLYQEAVLSAKDSCTFIIDEGEIEPGPLPALKWKANGNSHAVFYNGKNYVIETTRTPFISFVNFRDQNGSRILAFQTEVQGEYDGYGQIDVIWVGDLNRDGTPDFVCNYYSSYCSFDHLMFLSDSTKPNGFEIIRYDDIATGPCGC